MYRLIFLFIVFSFFIIFPVSEPKIQAQDDITIEVDPIPPTPGETPEETLNRCLEWYLEQNPLTWKRYLAECEEIVGYHGTLTFTAIDGMEGLESGVEYYAEGDVGEVTDYTTTLGQWNLNSIYSTQPEDYSFTVEGYERCAEPTLDFYSEQNAIDIGESAKLILHLNCDLQPMCHELIKLEVVSGPGELNLPEISSDEYNMLGSYQSIADKIIFTEYWNGKAEADLLATGSGVIEIKATFFACTGRENQGEIIQTVEVRAGKWVSIDCTYITDPERFGDSPLQWGGTVHAEVCLETIEEELYGYTITRLSGEARGTQDCWVVPDPDQWIENKNCPEFTATVCSGMVAIDVYTFMLDLPESAALTFDIVYNEGRGRLSCRELEPIKGMETPITLGFDPDSVFILSDTDIVGSEYEIRARWLD